MRDPDVYLSQTTLLIVAVVYFIVCAGVAWFIGRRRKVGMLWSFLFSVCLTPIVGAIITLSSSRPTKPSSNLL